MSAIRDDRCPARATAPRSLCAGIVVAWVLASGGVALALDADSADDVCSPAADPCNVTTVVTVANNAVLDFGVRTVSVTGGGQFDFGTGNGTIQCGPFSASTSNPAINAKGTGTGGDTESGFVSILARRLCTSASPKVPCLSLSDCQLGDCNTRRCTGLTTRTCTSDATCKVVCNGNKKCTGISGVPRCNTNADCDFGTCPAQLTCANKATNPLNCSSNSDCSFGTCTVGTASITIGGAIAGNSDTPAVLILHAADSIMISKLVNVAGTSTQSDGGEMTIEAEAGSVTTSAKLNAGSGGAGLGGEVDISAGLDVEIGEQIDITGGDSDGGVADIEAGRDIKIERSVLGNASGGAGYGGEIFMEAGRDLLITGVSSSNKTTIEATGHTDLTGFAGDGGTQELSAGRDFSLDENSRLIANGSTPSGLGGEVFLGADRNLDINGGVTAAGIGGQSGGGTVQTDSDGVTTIAASGTFDLTGGLGGGGALEIDTSGGNVVFSGSADVSGTNGGGGGSAFVGADGDASVNGTLMVDGAGTGTLEADGCTLRLEATGKLDNKIAAGENTLLARERMTLVSGSSMTTGGGANTLIYRNPQRPPTVSGTVSPAAQTVLDTTLTPCLVCGNSFVDGAETCDDGNTAGGDGCSSDCQNEQCIAQTVAPGYPEVALCEDGNPCTADFCNPTQNGGTCKHPAKNCDDSIACTVDSCGADGCVNAPNAAACDDSNPCTDDFCAVETGCDTTDNNNACDDNNDCTSDDHCSASVCQGTPQQQCAVCGDGVLTPPEPCDDGNATFAFGEYCGVDCVLIPCGKPLNTSGSLPKSSDAQFTLKAAVHQVTCSPRVCDVDNSGAVFSSDALRILKKAVGQVGIVLNCPTS